MSNGADDLDEFRALSAPERDARIYQTARETHARTLDLYNGFGEVAGELAQTREALHRYAAALEVALAGALKKSKSIPPMRDKFPSILEEREDDDKALRELKAKVTPLILERDAELAVLDWWKKLGRVAVVVAGLIVALAAVAGIIWALFRYAVAHAT